MMCTRSDRNCAGVPNRQLFECYRSVLDAIEMLLETPDGRMVVAFCRISIGMYTYPVQEAAAVAVDAVADRLEHNKHTSITSVVVARWTIPDIGQEPRMRPFLFLLLFFCDVGVRLSASDGLDYTSSDPFCQELLGFLKYRLRTLCVFSFNGCTAEKVRRGCFFTRLGREVWRERPHENFQRRGNPTACTSSTGCSLTSL
ncbi:hypothetical protein LY76DRAFT_677958 [Colletotrichum caudatum]|nr:hypothetical protein LY76DRAFT_677958 [Colletotrichum caudatum]